MKNLIFICFCLFRYGAYGSDAWIPHKVTPLQLQVIQQAQGKSGDLTGFLSIYEDKYLKAIYSEKSTSELEAENDMLRMGMHILSIAREATLPQTQLDQLEEIAKKYQKLSFSTHSVLGNLLFCIREILDNKASILRAKKKGIENRSAIFQQENYIYSALTKLAIAKQLRALFENEELFLQTLSQGFCVPITVPYPLENLILSTKSATPHLYYEMNSIIKIYFCGVIDSHLTDAYSQVHQRINQKYQGLWLFYEQILLLPRLRVLSALLKERQQISLADFLLFLEKYDATTPENAIPIPEEETPIVENQTQIGDGTYPERNPDTILATLIATEAESEEVDFAHSSEWTTVKTDSDWVIEEFEKGKTTTILATRIRKGKSERLSLTLKKPKGERVPEVFRSQTAPPCIRTYNRPGEEWKQRDPDHQFPSAVDSFILRYAVIERKKEKVLIQDRMVDKSYTFVRCFVISMTWEIEGHPPILSFANERAPATLEYIFSGELGEGKPMGEVYHRLLRRNPTID
jgi:hypothetical protein